MNRFGYYQRGFTIIELFLVTFIMLLAIGGAIVIYLMLLTAWKEGGVQIALQREASIAMEKMARGIDGMNGIREAKSVTLPNTTTIRYTSGIDSQERSFYLSGSELIYDPDTSSSDDEFSIAENVRTTAFSISDNLVTIDLGLEDQVIDKAINVDLSTQVKLRN